MKQTEKISLLLGRLEHMETQAARVQKELAQLMEDLSSLKKSLSGSESPYGIVYPRKDNE
ncbi:MAG: hypothetical protein MJ053_05905 [Elusimicrobiaceae bacterium]|nr:hypothetical protein [Elusimicrobiaceae bacterium]